MKPDAASKAEIKIALDSIGWFGDEGAYVLVDGQYGSTGKGLASGLLAELYAHKVNWVTSNAGPNSGHTSYYGDEKIILKQLPTFPVVAWKMGKVVPAYLNAGAIVDLDILDQECTDHNMDVNVHPHAARINDEAIHDDAKRVSAIGSTGKGTGAALAMKIGRDPDAVVGFNGPKPEWGRIMSRFNDDTFETGVGLVEVSQGFSLGLNSGFYPYTTSRECTVMQALSDARINPYLYRQSMMVVRTFPIRVAGNSGPCYHDQKEVTWDMLGVEPELTTVTHKVRRVFTFSVEQFKDAVRVNKPKVILLNFVNYLETVGVDVESFILENVIEPYVEVMEQDPVLLLGWGPKSSDVSLWEGY